ncbi:hypothetical protein MMC14_010555 [Varicellaria rhodocarpa]|nr:hypothetical protein [Varicellaria rhodocarpa]
MAILSSHGPMQLSRNSPNPPSEDASERTWRAYRRDLQQFEREKASLEQSRADMTEGSWKAFQSFQRWQLGMQESGDDLEFLKKSIAKFPRLEEVEMATGDRRGQMLLVNAVGYHYQRVSYMSSCTNCSRADRRKRTQAAEGAARSGV